MSIICLFENCMEPAIDPDNGRCQKHASPTVVKPMKQFEDIKEGNYRMNTELFSKTDLEFILECVSKWEEKYGDDDEETIGVIIDKLRGLVGKSPLRGIDELRYIEEKDITK